MPVYLVEAYTPTRALLPEIETRILRATRDASVDGPVRHLRTIYVPGDQNCFHLLEAPTSQQAHAVAELAGLEAQRIVEAVQQEPAPAPQIRGAKV